MKVCLLTPEFLPTWGGIGTYTYYLARELQDKVDVHVVTSEAVPELSDLQGLDRVHLHRLPRTAADSTGARYLRFQLAVARHLARLSREYGFDIVHGNHAQMSDLLVPRKRGHGTPVTTVHTTLSTQLNGTLGGLGSARPQGVERNVLRHRRLLRAIERRYLRRRASLIFVSGYVRDHTLETYRVRPLHGRVIWNAVDTHMFRPNGAALRQGRRERWADPRDPGFTLLYAGRLLLQKGLGTLLEALILLPPRVRLVLAGPGDPQPWRDFAASLGVAPSRLTFLGPVAFEAMPALYHRADALILPSFTESCPMTALEAMASGTPLIASKVGGVPEIVRDGETGWLFPAGHAHSLALRIRQVMEGGQAVQATKARARSWVESNATLDRMARETLRFYSRILDDTAGSRPASSRHAVTAATDVGRQRDADRGVPR